ncbi:hypothetical protein B2G71_12235 [Novosphingobium sp. PC22D]|uniref:LuxR C-terminal-related transcriptional regulator n=1 Tax=Novosphingobium sp. PC22D TaxID=1962403 RepID=UPI000BF10C55|nr:LuxR C-terminal-related transcriptional regulator [Novosphingobium sp. PC22D]PEQ12272.1 hypothetical protein B2G71_12235 [Novosphingobium sp. PC22D]
MSHAKMMGPSESTSSRMRAARRRLQPPRPPADTENQASVLRSLNAARHTPLTLVIAPAGFGKTTALAHWCEALAGQNVATAWYSVATPEQDPVAFLAMVSRSLARAGLDCPAETDVLGGMSAPALLDAVILALDRWRKPLVLIIDEYERVDCAPVAELVETIVENLPPDLHILISGRTKPRLPFATWRLQGLTRIIEAADLALSQEDVARALSIEADPAEVERLYTLTRGWPVAVQLYKLWRAQVGLEANTRNFTGKVEEVANYFAQRVFDTLSEECRGLLIELAILEEIEVAAADQVRAKTDSAPLLAEIERHLGPLLSRTDAADVVAYRLHPLLRSYAHAELEKQPTLFSAVRLAAAEWLWENQHYPESVRLYVQAGAQDRFLARLTGLQLIKLFLNYGNAELRLIVREVPQAVIDRSPRLRMMLCLIHFKEGLFAESRRLLAALRAETEDYRRDPDGDARSLEIEGNALELLFDTYMRGMPEQPEATCERTMELARDVPLVWAWCHNVMLVVFQFRGEMDAAEQELNAAAAVYESISMTSFASQHLEMHRILIALAKGVLHQAARIAGGLVRHPHQIPAGVKDPGLQTMGRLTLAIVDYYQNHRLGAADMVAFAIKQFGVGEAWSDHRAFAWPVMLDGAWRRHGLDEVIDQIESHRAQMRQRDVTASTALLDALEVGYLARSGKLDRAKARIVEAGLEQIAKGEVPAAGWHACEQSRLALGRVALIEENWPRLREIGETMVATGANLGRVAGEIHGHLLLALGHDRQGDGPSASVSLRSALRLALPEQWLMPFAQYGEALKPLLLRVPSTGLGGAEQVLVERIVGALQEEQKSADPNALSEREAEIVAHIAEGASNKLVARRLGISDNTVKFHLKKIYAKLGVSSRQAAVARVMEQHLL